jgi:signal transduction histidine kinase
LGLGRIGVPIASGRKTIRACPRRNRQAAGRERQLALTVRAREPLAERNAQLRELDRLKDEFVALVAHELRTH